MIQRIQTIWLALAGACLAGLFFVPNDFLVITQFIGDDVKTANFYSNLAGPIMLGLATVATFGAIFLFANRPQQLKIARLALLDTLLFLIVSGLLLYVEFQKNGGTGSFGTSWAIGLPVAAMVFQFLAFRAIKSDENLVQSAERLR